MRFHSHLSGGLRLRNYRAIAGNHKFSSRFSVVAELRWLPEVDRICKCLRQSSQTEVCAPGNDYGEGRNIASACYESNLPVQRVMLRCDGIHDDSDAPLQPVEPNSRESQDEDENIEFDSDESVENDGVEDDTRTTSYDEPQLAPDAFFPYWTPM